MKRIALLALVIVLVLGMAGVSQAARYVNNLDGTVTDTQTGLMWERSSSVRPKYWSSTANYCKNRTTGGHNDWRVPRVDELANVVEYGNYPATSPVLKIKEALWSNTDYAYHGTKLKLNWEVSFGSGQVHPTERYWKRSVRCVRGESPWPLDPSERLELNTENTVKDTYFNLIWQKSNDGVARSITKAKQYCHDLKLDGYTNWRMPSTRELQTIIDYTRYGPALPTEILESYPKDSSTYWTNNVDPWIESTGHSSAKLVGFGNGVIYGAFAHARDKYLTRCVHDEP